jgi:hypothetical protein
LNFRDKRRYCPHSYADSSRMALVMYRDTTANCSLARIVNARSFYPMGKISFVCLILFGNKGLCWTIFEKCLDFNRIFDPICFFLPLLTCQVSCRSVSSPGAPLWFVWKLNPIQFLFTYTQAYFGII